MEGNTNLESLKEVLRCWHWELTKGESRTSFHVALVSGTILDLTYLKNTLCRHVLGSVGVSETEQQMEVSRKSFKMALGLYFAMFVTF